MTFDENLAAQAEAAAPRPALVCPRCRNLTRERTSTGNGFCRPCDYIFGRTDSVTFSQSEAVALQWLAERGRHAGRGPVMTPEDTREALVRLQAIPPAEAREDECCGQCECCAAWRKSNDALRAQVQALTEERDEARRLHQELVFQVATKRPNETRHETAKRYIREREEGQIGGPAAALRAAPPPKEYK